jgi:hypothetical protein
MPSYISIIIFIEAALAHKVSQWWSAAAVFGCSAMHQQQLIFNSLYYVSSA